LIGWLVEKMQVTWMDVCCCANEWTISPGYLERVTMVLDREDCCAAEEEVDDG
jgi:hypothetical protein